MSSQAEVQSSSGAAALGNVLDAAILQSQLTSLRDERKEATMSMLKELDSSARTAGSSSSQLPQIITLKAGSAAADILTFELLLSTDISGCRIQQLAEDGTITLPEESEEALHALTQLFEGKACDCTALVLGGIIRLCNYCPAEGILLCACPKLSAASRCSNRYAQT